MRTLIECHPSPRITGPGESRHMSRGGPHRPHDSGAHAPGDRVTGVEVTGATATRSATTSEAAGPRRFRPDIQGLRAVAVGLVVAYHAGVPLVTGGYVGVDVFFVISGFLMTSKLIRMLRSGGRVRFGEFYAGRIRRILPVSFVVLLVTLVASFIIAAPLRFLQIAQDAAATALYVPNMLFAVQGTAYLGNHTASPYQQYWSLGVEEQFYLIWPLLLAVLWLLVRSSTTRLAIVLAVLVVVSLIACVIVTGASQPWAFFSLPTRAWELGAGGLVALMGSRAHLRTGPVAAVIGWLGLGAVLVSALHFTDATLFPGHAAIVPVVGTAAVIWAGANASRGDPTLLLGTRPFRFIGDISYSIYLWHWPLLILPEIALGTTLTLKWKLLLAVASIGLAMLSYRFVEQPFRESRHVRGWTIRRSVAFALVTALVLAAVSFGGGLVFGLRVLDFGPPVASVPASSPPVFAKQVPMNLTPRLHDSATDVPEVFPSGCMRGDPTDLKRCVYGDPNGSVTWAMFGDSHMANWMPATDIYAQAHGIRLVVYGKAGCLVSDVVPFVNGAPFTECLQWRTLVLKKLNALKPAVIIMVNSSVTAIQAPDGTVLTAPVGKKITLWDEGLKRMLAQLPQSAQAIFVADNPSFTNPPADCLSAHPRDSSPCWEPRSTVLYSAWNAGLATTMGEMDGSFLDMTDYLCNPTTCGAIEGNVLLYSDTAHLSNTGSKYLAAAFARQLTAALER